MHPALTGFVVAAISATVVWFAVPILDNAVPAGEYVEISGKIDESMLKHVRSQLQARPRARFVLLNSPGGLVSVADKLRDLIADRSMSTYVGKSCASACALVFLAGYERVLRPGARIGFHQYRVARGRGTEQHARWVELDDQDYMRRRGISSDFIARAYVASKKRCGIRPWPRWGSPNMLPMF
jgi:membrane-bound ClpP family serine protease